MKEPTKADLAAENERLGKENAGLRDLLGAVRAYADLPHPADYNHPSYPYETERRLDAIAIWANCDQDDMDPGIYLLVMQDRAKHLREEAARPVRYEVRAAPRAAANPPHHMTGNMIGPPCDAEDGNYICNAQDGHDGPDHVAYGSENRECHRWPVAAGTPLLVTDDEPRAPLCDSEMPLKNGGTLKCTLDQGHYGAHSAIAGMHRWLGHGADARDENGDKIAPASVTA